MNNSDFQRLLTTNDKELISELTKAKKKAGGKKERAPRPRPGKGKGKGKGGEKGGEADAEAEARRKEQEKYRDRAKDRRELKGEYENIAKEWEAQPELDIEQSKYMGGDLEHTHLVKGLDRALLSKVRTELLKKQKVDEVHKVRQERKAQQKKKTFETLLGRQVWKALVDTLHPHHVTFKQRVEKMSKAISMGQQIRGAPTSFLPGRMFYEFDTGADLGPSDIPRIIYASKDEAVRLDKTRRVASILPETVSRVRTVMQQAAERRKLYRQQKAMMAQGGYSVAKVSKYKAKDAADDIFSGVGGFSAAEVEKQEQEKKAAAAAKLPKKPVPVKKEEEADLPSYWNDVSVAPGEQMEPKDLDALYGESAQDGDDFQASSKWRGPRRGWAFKLGDKGLGYYRDAKSAPKTEPAADGVRQPLRRQPAPAPKTTKAASADDAYDECFPSAGLGLAQMHTGDADSDEEDGEKKKGSKLAQKLAKKKGEKGGESVSANQKGEAKKRKLNENQQWQKIDNMIKKGKHGTLAELEAQANKRGGRAPVPREIMSTPAFF